VDDIGTLLAQIRAYLDAPAGATPDIARMERTLTDGYAHALTLEGERRRIERRIGAVAATLEEGDKEGKAKELGELSRRLELANDQLSQLRSLLNALKARAAAVRVA